jgi:hypothetical protein
MVFCSVLTVCSAQEVQIGRTHIRFEYTSTAELPLGADASAEVDSTGKIVIHRSITDNTRHLFFGYDLTVDPQLPDVYTAAFRPLQLNSGRLLVWPSFQHPENPSDWSYQQPPLYPPRFTLQAGALSAIRLKPQSNGREQLTGSIAIETQFFLTTLRLNDAPQFLPRLDPVRGELVWFYIPLHGRYILSFAPRPTLGFIKAGTIHGKLCDFVIDGDRIEFGAVPAGVLDRELYVFHDAEFEPTRAAEKDKVLTGTVGAKELAQLIRR